MSTLQKIIIFLSILLISESFLSDTLALSSSIQQAENYPGKLNIKNVNGLGKNISNDLFWGTMNFRYPLIFPVGSRKMSPSLELTYNSNNTDAFSPYGYGFSLSLLRIQRNTKKWVSELYIWDEFSALWNDLVRESTGSNIFRSKDISDMNRYTRTGSGWTVETIDGKILELWMYQTSRISDPWDPSKVYAWLLDEEKDIFWHSIRYHYFSDKGQSYIDEITYAFDANNINPLYSIRFEYKDKWASLTSYRTQFEISTRKLLSKVSIYVDKTYTRSYIFSYDNPDAAISHLVSIWEISSTGETEPKNLFSYGSWQFQHFITKIDNQRGAVARFSYAPSTAYRNGSGELLNSKLPFIVMTLASQLLEDQVTGIQKREQYTYESGHYYYDTSDFCGKEYVGFARVIATDEKIRKVLSFHQSQNSEPNPQKYQDHIAKKWKAYKTEIFDLETGKLLQSELIRFDMKTFGERRMVFPAYKIDSEYVTSWDHSDTAVSYEYDDIWNVLKEVHHGWVNAHIDNATFTEIPGDEMWTEKKYTSNPPKNLYSFPISERLFGFSWELLSDTTTSYDSMGSWVGLWLVTRQSRRDTLTWEEFSDNFIYDSSGLLSSKTDALGNNTLSAYDSRGIALSSTTNPLWWKTRFTYSYALSKIIEEEDMNGVKRSTLYDSWGRELEKRVNFDGIDTLLSRTDYDDIVIPNNLTQITYFDRTLSDKKTTKNYLDGWGRVIETTTSTEKLGQFSTSQVRYDQDGNPIYAGYPVFTSSDELTPSLILSGVTSGETYRIQSPWVSYMYDALGRIIKQRDAKGITTKSYTSKSESLTNALWLTTISYKDAYENLTSLVEKLPDKDITTRYNYDALGQPTQLIDTYGNMRSWKYDGLSRLSEATDLHKVWDTTYGVKSYLYDRLSRLQKYTNQKGETIWYRYDPVSRLTEENAGSGFTRTYNYDKGIRSLNTLSSVSDPSSRVEYGYDALGRKVSETRTISEIPYKLQYSYNIQNVISSIIYPDFGKTEYIYKNGYVEWVNYTSPDGTNTRIISDISYAPNSTMKSVRYGNGVVKDTTRDPDYNYRLSTAQARTNDGYKVLDTEYRYDAINNINRVIEKGIEPLRKNIDYTYDLLSRLKSANYIYGINWYGREQSQNILYTYDDIWNITSASPVGTYTYSGEGFFNPDAVTYAGWVNYWYDKAGNTISRVEATGSLTFSYSPHGEMISSSRDSILSSYTYDHTHRRITKSTPWLTEHHIIDGYEVEYESGIMIQLSGNSNIIEGWVGSGSTSTGNIMSSSGEVNPWSLTGSEIQNNTGSTSTQSWIEDIPVGIVGEIWSYTGNAESNSWWTRIYSGSTGGSSWSYGIIAGYYASFETGATPVNLVTLITHVMLGDEKIATYQYQTDDSPQTPEEKSLIFHISDHLNSSSIDLSRTGSLLQATDYLPFGKTLTYEVSNRRIKGKKWGYTNKYLFAAKQLDEETDLQYFEKRYYDNRIGRFTSEDPVFWEVWLTKRPLQYFTDPEQWNTYSYVRNNPINLVDPTGEISYSEPVITDKFYQTSYIAIWRNVWFEEMLSHYVLWNGTPIWVPLDQVSLPEIKPEQFWAVQTIIKNGVAWEYNIHTNKADPEKNSLFAIGVSTQNFSDRAWHWHIRLVIWWKLTINKDGSWKFDWVIRGGPDVYNANQWTYRTPIEEGSTYVLRHIPWEPYTVIFTWTKWIAWSWVIPTKKANEIISNF